MKLGKRSLFIAHRWLGILLCLLMGMWFLSGVVMMYVGYPKLTPHERLAHLPALVLTKDCCISPARAVVIARQEAAKEPHPVRKSNRLGNSEIKLLTIGQSNFWLVTLNGEKPIAVDATTGQAKTTFDARHAVAAAKQFSPLTKPVLVEEVQQDIFTVSRALDIHRPLYRALLNDPQGTELYISSRTGEVVRDSTRFERGWNYLGSILHWFYPLKGEFFNKWRSDIIIYTSLSGTLLAILGIWIGFLRWRFKTKFANGSHTPYREQWMRWHHLTGLVFGLITVTWIFSGLMSMNPWKIFATQGKKPDLHAFEGISIPDANFTLTPQEALSKAGFIPRELNIRLLNGRAYYVLYSSNGRTQVIAADEGKTSPASFDIFTKQALIEVAPRLLDGYKITRITWLEDYDNYYYVRKPHTMTGHIERRLPILRIEFNDPNHTWVHIDPYTGAVFNHIDDSRRTSRWLFNFLHSWDIPQFINNRPLWDITLIMLSIGGFILCLSGTIIAWRRLRRLA